MYCRMAFGSLLSFEGALATWMTAFELPLRGGGWHATKIPGGGMRHAVFETRTRCKDFTGLDFGRILASGRLSM